MFPNADGPALFVFSHPNHELGVFGILQRLRPHIVYLTEGGGGERIDETRSGLAGIGLLERAVFLDVPEAACYDAFVRRDATVFAGMSRRIAAHFRTLRPAQVFCDAVEYYNPVHDVALPVVLAMLGADEAVPVFEIPLISQKPSGDESYEVQRPSPGASGQVLELNLTAPELAKKLEAFHDVYHILRELLAGALGDSPLTFVDTEVVIPARPPLTPPGEGCVLRYERRARLLKERGEVAEEITWGGHYVPVVTSLLAGP